jgi:hypothetical protein
MTIALCVCIAIGCVVLVALAVIAAGWIFYILEDIERHPERYQ